MTPTVIDSVPALRAHLAGVRVAAERAPSAGIRDARRVGLVPTMGALHAGHASLIDRARQECGHVVVSIFVNPLQFDRPDDLARYPRTLDPDVDLCAKHGVDCVFAPSDREMYPEPPLCTIDVGPLAAHLCGRHRPGHFQGVATVVMKLLQMVQPDAAYFGEKDAQQLAIIRRLVTDFSVPVIIVGMPTVREPDGLALSSRNQRLSPRERAEATVLYRVLDAARRRIAAGAADPADVRRHALAAAGTDREFEYLEIVDPATMQPVPRISAPVVVAGALWVGTTRLIDNVRAVPQA